MAFPTTPILDSGAGADQNPLAGNWTSPVWSEGAMQRTGGKLGGTTGSYNSAAWNLAQFGPDCEFYVTLDTTDTTANFLLHLKTNVIGSSSATLNDYFVYVNTGAGTIGLYKNANGVGAQLASFSQVLAAGDSLGMQAVGSALRVFYKAAGGSWVQLGSDTTDATYSGQSGYVVLEQAGGIARFTNIGGGTYNPATVPANTAAPTISGHPNVGQSMSSTTGTWSGSPTSFAYQWQTSPNGSTGWADISGATGASYAITAADQGNWLRCNVVASNASGPSSAASSAATLTAVAASVSFPTTPVIFNPASANDENPLTQGGQFPAEAIQTTASRLQVVSHQVVPTTANTDNQAHTSASYGADAEVYVTVPTLPAAGGAILLWLRVATPNTVGVDGYVWWYLGGNWRYYRVDNAGFTQLGATDTTYTLVAGDSVGFSIIGTTLTGYHAPANKPWVAHATQTDATYSAAGPLGYEIDTPAASTVGALTLLGGGTIAAAAGTDTLTLLHAG